MGIILADSDLDVKLRHPASLCELRRDKSGFVSRLRSDRTASQQEAHE
jgi:hypothetical protein